MYGFLQDIKACPWLYQHSTKHRMNHISLSISYRYVGSRPKVWYTRALRTQVHHHKVHHLSSSSHQSSSSVPLYQWLQGCQHFSCSMTISKSSMNPWAHKWPHNGSFGQFAGMILRANFIPMANFKGYPKKSGRIFILKCFYFI